MAAIRYNDRMAGFDKTPEELTQFVLSDPLCRDLAAIAAEHGRPMALVGGCVRDWLLGREPLDWDVVVPGDPTPLARALLQRHPGALVTLDADFGVVRTPLRNGVSVDFTRQQGDTLEEDLQRRDLAVNALALRLDDGALVDPTRGLDDMELQRIRAVSKRNLEDDPLRLLRVFRFASTLGWRVEDLTREWVEALAPRIVEPAGERILAELVKLLDGPCAASALAEAYHAGLLAAMIPELAESPTGLGRGIGMFRAIECDMIEMREEVDPAEARTLDLLAKPLAGDRPARVAVFMAALLYPLAGDADAIAEVCERWKLSAKERHWITQAIAGASAAPVLKAASGREAATLHHRFVKELKEVSHAAALLGLESTAWDSHEGSADWVRWHQAFQRFYWAWVDARAAEPRLLSGNDLQRELGQTPGPHFAPILDAIDEARTLGDISSREEALAWAARMLAERE
jgi:tRNA nucleotidyltransferase/poly(A) polymerase